MRRTFLNLTIAGILCAALGLSATAGGQSGNGEPEDSWAEQRADGGLELSIKLSPQTVNFDSLAVDGLLTVHTDIGYACVDVGTLALSGIPVSNAFADDRGNLVAKFSLAAVTEIVEPPSTELTLTGMSTDGVAFAGSDILQVLDPKAE